MSHQSQIDAINDILEKLNEKYGRNSCNLKQQQQQQQQEQQEQQQQQQQQEELVYEPFEINDPHLIINSLCRLMRSRL